MSMILTFLSFLVLGSEKKFDDERENSSRSLVLIISIFFYSLTKIGGMSRAYLTRLFLRMIFVNYE
jgi:hypothetical protein